MLVITCGDSAGGTLADAGLPGGSAILVWNDLLHEGPVPAGLDLAGLSAVRAEWAARAGWRTREAARDEFAARDRALHDFRAHDEVVLCFDANLVNQLQLVQLLDYFTGAGPAKVSLALVDDLGPAGPDVLADAIDARVPVTDAQLDLARTAWAAVRDPDPAALQRLAAEALPPLGPALTRLLEQYPDTVSGLSRTERQGLEALAAGLTAFPDLFAYQAAQEPRVFLGDSVFAAHLDALAAAPTPLLTGGGDRRLTDFGADVLAGRADHAGVNGIDRWVGGVHLTGTAPAWRWDRGAGRLVRTP
jgi:hypothetical protein